MTSWCHRATCARTEPAQARRVWGGLAMLLLAASAHAHGEGDAAAALEVATEPVDRWSLDGELRLRADYHREPSRSATRWFARTGVEGDVAGAAVRIEAEAEWTRTPWGSSERVGLGEAHLTWSGGWGTLRVGRQQVAWGRADGFRLLDEVNPQRYPQALYGEPQDARIPLWLANWEGEAGPLQWQLLGGRGRELESADPVYPQFGGRLRDEPRQVGDDWLLGARTGVLVADVDLAAYWLEGPDPRPPLRVDAEGVRPEPVRRRLAGISLDRPLGTAVLRVEATRADSRSLAIAGDLQPARLHQLLVGLDLRPGAWFVSPQLYREIGAGGGALSAEDGERHYASLLVQRAWWQDSLAVRGLWMGGIGRSDYWASLRATYQWGARWEWRMHWDRFGGTRATALGALDTLDRFGVEAVAHF